MESLANIYEVRESFPTSSRAKMLAWNAASAGLIQMIRLVDEQSDALVQKILNDINQHRKETHERNNN